MGRPGQTMSDAAAAVLITGASSGIGAALARAYAKRGARLGLGRREEALALCAKLAGGASLVLVADVGDALQIAGRHDVSCRFRFPAWSLPMRACRWDAKYASDLTTFEVLRQILLGMVSTFQPFVSPCASAKRPAWSVSRRWQASAACLVWGPGASKAAVIITWKAFASRCTARGQGGDGRARLHPHTDDRRKRFSDALSDGARRRGRPDPQDGGRRATL